MTCQDCNDRLPEYLDETLDAAARAETTQHLASCRDCQWALRRMQALGQALQGALERETRHLTLARETRAAILRAAEAAPAAAPAGPAGWWRWWSWRPLPALAGVATLAAALLIAVQWQGPRAAPRDVRGTWSIDVPFQADGQVGVIHAHFSEP